jgi:hypothetical protein
MGSRLGPMGSRLRSHLTYANVISTVCLFLLLGGGSAVALTGSNTVFSDDITDNQVYSADVRNDALSGGGLAAVDLRANSVGSSELTNGSLGTGELSHSIPATRVTHSSAQSIPDFPPGATLAFDTERYDTANMHNNATNNSRLTAPVNGIYAVTAEVDWTPDATGTRELTLMKNGSTFIADDDRDGISVVLGGQSQSVTAQVRLVAGDFVEVGVLQTSGGSLNVMSAGETSPEFSLTWLAPGP